MHVVTCGWMSVQVVDAVNASIIYFQEGEQSDSLFIFSDLMLCDVKRITQ